MKVLKLTYHCVAALVLTSLGISTSAQNAGTGAYKYSSVDSPGFDSINPGNLDVHFSIPVVSKTGRGLAFQYALVFDSLIWTPVTSGSSTVWSPDPEFGLHGYLLNDGYKGFLSYTNVSRKCFDDPSDPGYYEWLPITSNFVYHDEAGAQHAFNYSYNYCTDVQTGDGSSSDGSGFRTDGTNVYSVSGTTLNLATYVNGALNTLNAMVTDSNGNRITNDQNGTFTDTMGANPLIISGSGTPASPREFTYNTTNGGTAYVKVTYATKTVRTAYGCSGVTDYGPSSVNLPTTITLGDTTSTYSIVYEGTPGYAGDVTGRIKSITLPTGGTVTYTYSGSNNGINCSDGTTLGLSRSTSISNDGTISYARTNVTSTTSHTEVTGPHLDQTEIDYVLAGGVPYETTRSVYSGSHSSGTLLAKNDTCYNGIAPPNCTGQTLSLPVTELGTFYTIGSYQNGSDTTYNGYGLPTDIKEYDYGTTRTSVLRETQYAYAALGGYVSDRVSSIQTFNGATTQYAAITFGYDETSVTTTSGLPEHVPASGARGNLTSRKVCTSSSCTSSMAYIGAQYTYDDAGQVKSSVNVNLNSLGVSYPATSSYGYDATDTLLETITPPSPNSVSLATTYGYDSGTGLLTSVTDPNTQQTTYKYDSMLHLKEVDNPDSGKTTITPTSATQTSTYTYQNSTTFIDMETFYDGMGRPIRVAVANGQGTNPWYQADMCPNASSLTSFTSYPYQASSDTGAEVCSGAGDTVTYDPLGRLKSVAHGDGSSATYGYTGRASQVTGENGVSRISQADGLGRATTVCEISSHSLGSDSPVNCSLDITGTGYLTTYAYDDANLKTTVTQGVQTRVFQTDWAGRPTVVQEPERGQTTYGYDFNAQGLVVTRKRPQANQSNSSTLTTTTSQYDSVGRPISISYSDGTPTKSYAYDASAGWTDLTQNNLAGRMSMAAVSNAKTIYGYDPMGRISDLDQCLPFGCGNSTYNKKLHYTYDEAGNLLTSTDGGGVTSTYTVSVANELMSLATSSSNPSNLVTNVQNGPNGPVSFNLGNGLSSLYSYDGMGRLNGGWVCNGTPSANCSTQVYGFTAGWKGVQLQSSTDSVLNQNSTYGYDEFNRLASRTVTSGTIQNYTYAYDRYGNRTNQTSNGGTTTDLVFNTANNQVASGTCNPPTHTQYCYDAAGNMTADSSHTYGYDAEGNVTYVDGSSTALYGYDALNHRVSTKYGSTIREFIFDQWGRRASIWDGSSPHAQTQGQYYLGATPVAYYDTAAHFEHQDWLGTERMRTAHNYSTGGVEGSFTSLPFGDAQTTSGTDTETYYFASLDYDSGSLTDHAQFREYSNNQGRWLSPDPYMGSYDPLNPQSLNRYTYVLNNPLSAIDPAGLDDCSVQDAAAHGRGGVHAMDDNGGGCGDDPGGGGGGGGGGDPASGPPETPAPPDCNAGDTVCVTGDPPPDPEPAPPPDPCTLVNCMGGGGQVPGLPGAGGGGGAPNNGTTCPAVPFKVTGIAPGQAPGTTAISQTPRAGILNGGVAIKPGNFGVGGINGGNRSVFLGMTFTVDWSTAGPLGVPAGIPTQGPFFPVDNIGPASVRNSPGNAFDVYNYPSFKQAWASTRTVMVKTYIPANTAGVKCPQ